MRYAPRKLYFYISYSQSCCIQWTLPTFIMVCAKHYLYNALILSGSFANSATNEVVTRFYLCPFLTVLVPNWVRFVRGLAGRGRLAPPFRLQFRRCQNSLLASLLQHNFLSVNPFLLQRNKFYVEWPKYTQPCSIHV